MNYSIVSLFLSFSISLDFELTYFDTTYLERKEKGENIYVPTHKVQIQTEKRLEIQQNKLNYDEIHGVRMTTYAKLFFYVIFRGLKVAFTNIFHDLRL